MDFWNAIGFTASLLGAATYVPEVLKALKSKHLNDVAWGMLLLVLSSSALWIIFGIKFGLFPIIFSSAINFVSSFTLMLLKYTFQNKNIVNSLEGIRIDANKSN